MEYPDNNSNKSNILIKKYISIGNIIYEYIFNYLLLVIISINLYLINHYIDKLEKININQECEKYLDNSTNNYCLYFYHYLLNKFMFGKKITELIFYSNIIIIFIGILIKFTFGTNTLKKYILKIFTKLHKNIDTNLLIQPNINFISNNILTILNIIQVLLYLLPSTYYNNITFKINPTIIDKFDYYNSIIIYIASIIVNEVMVLIFTVILIMALLYHLYIIISSNKHIINIINLINNLLKIEVEFIDSDELNFNEKIV